MEVPRCILSHISNVGEAHPAMNVTVRKLDDLCPFYKGFYRVKRLLMNDPEQGLGGDAGIRTLDTALDRITV
jgi:hypothetical protein